MPPRDFCSCPVNCYICFVISLLLQVLQELPEAAVCWPSDDKFNKLSEIIQERHPHLNGAFGSLDGLNLTSKESSDPTIENATYNGWLHSHCYSCVMAFSLKGLCFPCVHVETGLNMDSHHTIFRPPYCLQSQCIRKLA
ncbi:hypothetical protein QCA50_016738 [Cerrena zonata]|uniref:Uncharacterized protein n=1 Tax=Cerrena zonata TaxID=2478898 RepID=A0AAW0FPT0_9APHY